VKKTWAFAWHFLTFVAMPFSGPFLVLFYQDRGLTGAQIGLLVGLTPLIRLFCTPLGTGLADATRRHRLTMDVGVLAGGATLFLLPWAGTFAPIALLTVLSTVLSAPVMPLATSATMSMLGEERAAYGRIRLGGTIGYGLAAAVAGTVVESQGLRLAFWVSAALHLLVLAVSQKLDYGQAEENASLRGGVRMLLGDARWLLFLTVAFAGGLAWVATNSYFLPYMAAVGAPESVMGIALTLGVVAEIPVLFYGDHLVRRFSAYGLLMLALGISGARLLAFAACGSPSPALLLQLTSGLAFPAMWLAGTLYAEENAPAGLSATAQGLFGSVITGLGAAVGGLFGGPLMESLGARGMFLVFGLVVLVVAAMAVAVGGRLQAGRRGLPRRL
jgi:PPP family 3-phenylpropionic acid transporter